MASPLAGRRIVVLPDFFVDAVVRLPPYEEAAPRMRAIARQGGGNLPVGPIELKVGGNAANCGLALARLGADVALVAETDRSGLHLLEKARALGLDIRRVREGPASSATLALEFGGANVMLSHSGPLAAFGPERLEREDWEAIEAADAVVVANWSQNQRGTELLRAVVRRLRGTGTFVAVDTADPRHRGADFGGLLAEADVWEGVGSWALNENEVRAAAGALGQEPPAGDGPDARARLRDAATELAGHLGCRLDLHTESWAVSVAPGKPTAETSWKPARPRRLTGAGDAWTAGNVAGHLLGVEAKARLRLAHAVARAYVTGRSGLPPGWEDLPAAVRQVPGRAPGKPGNGRGSAPAVRVTASARRR